MQRAEALGTSTAAFTRAYSHTFLAWYHQMAAEPQQAAEHATRSIEVGAQHGFPTWMATGALHLAISKATPSGHAEAVPTLVGGLLSWEQAGAESFRGYFLAGLAQAQLAAGEPSAARDAIDEALVHAAEHGELFYQAELHRFRSEIVLALDPDAVDEAAAALLDALTVARRQRARAFELRAATALHRLRAREGRPEETAAKLATIVSSFTDGVVTPDLVEARSALEPTVT
jgi:adenylate cyclase